VIVATLRADARRNRERILAAADRVFAANGTAASTDDVARAAGVGIGTVFRHFPTKETLLEAVVLERLRRLAEDAEALSGAEDPGEAFFTFLTRAVAGSPTKRTYVDALTEAGASLDVATTPAGQRLRRAIEALLSRAQRAGAVRTDIGAADVIAVLVGASRAAEFAGHDAERRERAVAIVVDGLRPLAARSTAH
jgi:AcrR family transcriptional regulator